MKRIETTVRNNWQQAVEKLGFEFHSSDSPYWDESVYYSFSMDEILKIEKASSDLWDLCVKAVEHVIENNLFSLFHIADIFIPYLKDSWNSDLPFLYGRFDLCYRNGEIKMLEFNADTPTSLYEAAIIQWFWLQDFEISKDQFNSIHEKLIARWHSLRSQLQPGTLYFSSLRGTLEDLTTVQYIRDCAMQAGIRTEHLYIDDLGWDEKDREFVDLAGSRVGNLFKLYPWEFMLREEFSHCLLRETNRMNIIEPAWKMILSNKAILPILWELFPNHPNLLPAYFEENSLSSYVKKPLLSREGANIEIVNDNRSICQTGGDYGSEGYIYQELFELPCFKGNYPVIGSWLIGDEPAGLGLRESGNLITDNLSRFIPHLIE